MINVSIAGFKAWDSTLHGTKRQANLMNFKGIYIKKNISTDCHISRVQTTEQFLKGLKDFSKRLFCLGTKSLDTFELCSSIKHSSNVTVLKSSLKGPGETLP